VHRQECFHYPLAHPPPLLLHFALRMHNQHIATAQRQIGERALPPRRLFLSDVVTLKDDAVRLRHHQSIRDCPHPYPPDENHGVVSAEPSRRAKPGDGIQDVEDELRLGAWKRRIDVVTAGRKKLRELTSEGGDVDVKTG